MKKFFVIFVFFMFFSPISFGNSDDDTVGGEKTLKQLKSSIADLKEEKVILNERVQTLIQENGELKSFFKQDLNPNDLEVIRGVIDKYNLYSKKIDDDLKNNAKNLENSPEEKELLLSEKSEAYKKLIPFIDEYKISNYLEFVKGDLTIFKEKGDVNEKIYLNEEILIKKVEKLKEKIVKNKEIIDLKLEKVINDKTLEKINFLKNSESFNKLDNEQKKEVILRIIEKIKLKVSILEKDGEKKNISAKKIEMYNLTLSLLNYFYEEFN